MEPKKAAKSKGKAKTGKKKVKVKAVKETVKPEERLHMIEEAAYFRFQHRAFQGENHPLQDWLEAEAEIDKLLS